MRERGRELLLSGARAFGIDLLPGQLHDFGVFFDELTKWNRRINLTAITAEEDVVIKHFVDSLTLVPLLGGADTLLDIGSGAGFPAVPVKILLPGLRVVSVDAVEKKVIFQKHLGRSLGLHEFEPLHARAETLPELYPAGFDVIVSRAFSGIPLFVSLALPLLKPGGTIIAMKGEGGIEEAAECAATIGDAGLRVSRYHELLLPLGKGKRVLLEIRRNT